MTESALRFSLRISSASFDSVVYDYAVREVHSSSSRWRQSRKISAGLLNLSSDHPPRRRPASRSPAEFSTAKISGSQVINSNLLVQSLRTHNRRLLQQNLPRADIGWRCRDVRFCPKA